MGVIVLHYNLNDGVSCSHGFSQAFLLFLESLNICAVDLFVLISGYFLVTTKRRDLLKPIKLIAQVILFSLGYYLVTVVVGRNKLSVRHLVRTFIPTNYYVILYVTLLIISPYINVVIDYVIEHRGQRLLFLITFCTCSVYPILVDILQGITGVTFDGLSSIGRYGSQWGYTLANFVMMYIIGALLHNYEIKHRTCALIVYLVFNVLLIFIWTYFEYRKTGGFVYVTALEYCNPMVVIEATLIFILFLRMGIQSKVINILAKGSFTVYLTHGYLLAHMRIAEFVSKTFPILLLHLLVSVVILYLIGWGVDYIYKLVTNPLWKKIDARWIMHRRYEV